MANPFDQFDARAAGENPFDKIEAPAGDKPEPGFTPGDYLLGLKRGVEGLPGAITGLADIPVALVAGDRYASKAADKLGEMTGFQPSKWAKADAEKFSPGGKAAMQEIGQAWEQSGADQLGNALLGNGNVGEAWDQSNFAGVGKALARNPGYALLQAVESAPSMLAGGAIGKGVQVASKVAPVIAGALGEGAVAAGQNMDQTDPSADPRKAALAAAAAGLGDALIAGAGGKLAQKIGLEDPQTLMAGGRATPGRGLPARVLGGAVSEGALQEFPQSMQEQAWQNYAEDKPLGEGVIRQGVEGGLTGAMMGGGANLMPSPKAPAAEPPPSDQELGAAADAVTGAVQDYHDLVPSDRPLLGYDPAGSVITVPTQAGSTVDIDANAGPVSAAAVAGAQTGALDLLATRTLLRSYPDRQAAQAALDARDDADRMAIAPHPRAAGRFAVVPKDRLTLQAMDEARAKQAQLEQEDGNAPEMAAAGDHGTGGVGSGSAGNPRSGEGLRGGNGAAARAPMGRGGADQSLGNADAVHAALTQDAAQSELQPTAAQPVSDLPGIQQRVADRLEQARSEAEARGARLIDEEASAAHPSPSEAQVAAGNYKKGHVKVGPLDISVENPVGSTRRGTENGKAWETTMQAHYGYVKRTEGADGDQVDVFVKAGTPNDYHGPVFVVDQFNPKTGRFDEHKAMIGYGSHAEAARAYDAHFGDRTGPKRRHAVVAMPLASFATWAREGDTSRPLSQAGKAADDAQAEIEQATGKRSPGRGRQKGETQEQYVQRKAAESNAAKQQRKAAFAPVERNDQAALSRELGEDARVVEATSLPNQSETTGNQLSRQVAKTIEGLAKVFKKRVVFFEAGANVDGLWVEGDAIYINAANQNSSVAHLRVLGHELTHVMRREAPEAYAAMFSAVKGLLTDDELRAQYQDYFGKPIEGEITDKVRDMVAEEWMADLAGNRFGEAGFWDDVFQRIEDANGPAAKGIINRLRLAVAAAINKILKAIRGRGFAVDARLTEHLEDIRQAVAEGFAQYARETKRGVAPAARAEAAPAGKTRPQFDGTKVAFEVAPDPNDVALTERWNALPEKVKAEISYDLASAVSRKVLVPYNLGESKLHTQMGGYLENTNPSFSLWMPTDLSAEKAQEITRVLGYVLKQDSMVIGSPKKFAGAIEMGVVVVKDVSETNSKAVYDELRAAVRDQNGEALINGHTTAEDHMAILVPLDSRKDIAQRVASHLGERHGVGSGTYFVQWPERGENEYGLFGRQTTGGAAAAEPSVQAYARQLREETTAEFERRVRAVEGKRSTGRGPDAGSAERPGGGDAQAGGSLSQYGQARFGAKPVVGRHYSAQERKSLDGRYYGTGAKGREYARVMASPDTRLRERVYFYVNAGQGVHPEQGVGSHAHEVQINNLYDADAQFWLQNKIPDKGIDRDAWLSKFESAVIDAGFDGYVSDFGRQRAAVLLGRHTVPVTYRGNGDLKAPAASQAEAAERPGDVVRKNRLLPMGAMPGAEWKRTVKDADLSVLEDDRTYYKDQVARAMDEAGVRSELAALFEGLSSRGLAKKRAEDTLDARPDAARLQNIQDNFIDILSELEDAGLLEINCD